ncbi:MAG: response regulator [Spirochaetales bacterium]|nr:response regulator [Spirochaetales bacterium]
MAKIMVVEDSDHFREGVVMALESQGHDVIQLNDGIHVEKELLKDSFDLIIMDIVMPEKGGVETMIDLRSNLGDTKLLLLTGKVSKDSTVLKNMLNHFGGSKVIFKPFKRNELLEEINILI